jgi:hypothetical protein
MTERINIKSMTFTNKGRYTRTYSVGDTIYLADFFNEELTFERMIITSFCEERGCRFAYGVDAEFAKTSTPTEDDEQYCALRLVFHREDALDFLRKSIRTIQLEIDKIESEGDHE